MARLNLSQLKSKIRSLQQKQRQAITNYNQAVRRYNQNVKRTIDNYNRNTKAYNAQIRVNRQRIVNELNRLKLQSKTTKYSTFHISVQTLHKSYERLESEAKYKQLNSVQNHFYDLSERENANNLHIMNSLFTENDDKDVFFSDIQNIKITNELNKISNDLDARYRGAVFALSPKNPDAARHFCTSTREIITKIINLNAPDISVISMYPDCEKTVDGKPTRRSKIKYILSHNNISDKELEDFVNSDVNNIIELYKIFNEGTHGGAGTFSYNQLLALKTRVEDSILFLTELVK